MSSWVVIMCLAAAAQSNDYSLLSEKSDNFSFLSTPINDYGPTEYKITIRAAIIEFYDGADGPTQETAKILQKFRNSDRTIERVRVVDNVSKLAVYFGVEKLPTFMTLYDKKEVDRVEGIPADGQLEEMYQKVAEHARFSDAIVNGQLVYFGTKSSDPGRASNDLLYDIKRAGGDIRKANYDVESQREWFDLYNVAEYPVFILIDRYGKELVRDEGDLLDRIWAVLKPSVKIGPVLLDFGAGGCNLCTKMKPVIASLEDKGYMIQKINTDQNRSLTAKYGVRLLPTFIILNSDGTEYNRKVGLVAESTLEKMLQDAR